MRWLTPVLLYSFAIARDRSCAAPASSNLNFRMDSAHLFAYNGAEAQGVGRQQPTSLLDTCAPVWYDLSDGRPICLWPSDEQMSDQRIDNLQHLCEVFPFLSALPHPLLADLDLSEFWWPSAGLLQTCVQLEKLLDAYIITYRSKAGMLARPSTYQLCRALLPAQLSPQQLGWLEQAEQSIRPFNILVVAYRKPLQLRSELVSRLLATSK